jgi:hypothetical protein
MLNNSDKMNKENQVVAKQNSKKITWILEDETEDYFKYIATIDYVELIKINPSTLYNVKIKQVQVTRTQYIHPVYLMFLLGDMNMGGIDSCIWSYVL